MSKALSKANVSEEFADVEEQFNKMVNRCRSKEMLEMELSELETWLQAEGQELFKRIIQGHDRLRQKDMDNSNTDGKLEAAD